LEPGVYWFTDKNDTILYVGKSKHLRARLRAYTQPERLPEKIRRMVFTAVRVQWKELPSEFDALLVESKLIRLHQPYFNTLSKDDKSPAYIVITNDAFARVLVVRENDIPLYSSGRKKPFTAGPFQSAYEAKQLLKFVRPVVRWCETAWKRGDTAKKQRSCFYHHIGLCSGACVGGYPATEYQRDISRLRSILQGKRTAVLLERKRAIDAAIREKRFEDAEMIKQQIQLLERLGSVRVLQRDGEGLPSLASKPSIKAINQAKSILQDYIDIPREVLFHRIECFDMSTIQGTNSVGSMVVALDGTPEKKEYRLFKVHGFTLPNDMAMMKQVLQRRQNHPEWGFPDLVVLDGGRTQLAGVLEVWNWTCPCIGLAKDPDRLVILTKMGKFVEIVLKMDDMGRMFKQLRDEAHRRAHGFHVFRRSKNMVE
jgi:excinuclease ABC subunit C